MFNLYEGYEKTVEALFGGKEDLPPMNSIFLQKHSVVLKS